VDRPNITYDVQRIIEGMKAFHGHVIIQTMFMRGTLVCADGFPPSETVSVDNTGEEYVAPWLDAVKAIQPQQVMVYTIDRETPAKGLEKISVEEMTSLVTPLLAEGFKIQIRG
jgi:hypothetical protein